MNSFKRLKVMTVVGTRPEVIKLSRVIAELDRHTDHVLVHSGQNYHRELNAIFFEELGISPPRHVLGVGGQGVAQVIADVITKSDAVMERELPDALLVYGDTNTCLCVIPAKRRKIPIFHMEAGNRCFDQRVPEELNRKVVDHLSDINMPLTEHARRYLLDEGLRPETVIKTGSTMKEVLDHHAPAIALSRALSELGLEPGDGKRVIVSTHPRTRARLEALAATGQGVDLEGVSFQKPFGFFDWVKLQENAFCVVSDSGTLTEESAIRGFPAVMLRDAHERPEGMDAGTLVMSGLDEERVVQAVEMVVSRPAGWRPGLPPDYAESNVSRKVVQIIQSYVDYVNRTVWHKE